MLMGTNLKNREWKSFQPRPFLYLFDHLISPILSHGCEMWGNKEWEEIEKLHRLTCKVSIGVESSTPNDGVYAELGRHRLVLRKRENDKVSLDYGKLITVGTQRMH